MLNAHGYLAKIFDVFREHQKSVDMISTSEVSVSLTLDDSSGMEEIITKLQGISEVKTEDQKAIICVVGEGIKNHVDTPSRVFSVVSTLGVNVEMISQGASEINISFVVNESDANNVVSALHKELIT